MTQAAEVAWARRCLDTFRPKCSYWQHDWRQQGNVLTTTCPACNGYLCLTFDLTRNPLVPVCRNGCAPEAVIGALGFEGSGLQLAPMPEAAKAELNGHVEPTEGEPTEELIHLNHLIRYKKISEIAVPEVPSEAFGADLQRLIEESAEVLHTAPDYVATALIPVVGALIGNRTTIDMGGDWRTRPIAYAALVGTSGAMKSPALDRAFFVLQRLQEDASADHKARMAEYEEDWLTWDGGNRKDRGPEPKKPMMRHFYTSNVTMEMLAKLAESNVGVCVKQDELVGWVNACDMYRGGKGNDRQTWLELHSGGALKGDRKTDGSSYFVPRPHICVVGGVQPAKLIGLAGDGMSDDGFLGRILFTWPDKRKKRYPKARIPLDTLARCDELLRSLRESPLPELLHLSPAAAALYEAWYNANAELEEQATGLTESMIGKLYTHSARIALMLHCLDYVGNASANLVSQDTIRRALILTEYYRAHAHRVYAYLDQSGPAPKSLAGRIFSVLRDQAGVWVDKSTLFEKLGRSVQAWRVDAELEALAGKGLVEGKRVHTGQKGRPAEFWRNTYSELNDSNELNQGIEVNRLLAEVQAAAGEDDQW